MQVQTGGRLGTRRRAALVATIVGVALLSVAVLPSAADHDGPHVTPLGRATFTDDVKAQLRVKLDGRARNVINVGDVSDAVLVKVEIGHGAVAPWHGHAGPGFLLNTGPGTLTSVLSSDCVPRQYPAGSAFVDPGQGTTHAAWNDSGQDVVLYALFLGVANGPVLPVSPPGDCDVLP
jgi:hypothetical protein